MARRITAHVLQPSIVVLGVVACVLINPTGHSAPTVVPTQIAQIPLTVAQEAHPQVALAIGNSESMDGNMSGAIMTGSGSLPASMSLLNNSSSPQTYTIPPGFTPPLNVGDGVNAPYTATDTHGHLADNSPSRLNVTKAGITAVLQSFMPYADFALLDYKLSGTTVNTTWVYEMSPPGGFVFTNTQVTGNRYIPNPCFNYNTLLTTNPVYTSCKNIDASGQVTGSMATSQWMQIDNTIFPPPPTGTAYNGGSSDDPLINDVLYAGGLAPVCLVYTGPTPGYPYTHFALFPAGGAGTYSQNPGNIHESYSHTINTCAPTTYPTNAGFVPYTTQVMYIQRGFGYNSGQDHNDANVAVPMTTAGAVPTPPTVAAAIAKFTPFLAPETNSLGTTEIKAAGGQSAIPGLLEQAVTLFNTNPAGSNGCTPTRYVILLTDGLPTLDKSGHSWPPPGTVSAVNWNMKVAFNPDGSLNTAATNDQAVIDTVNALAQLQNSTSHVKTYIIGLGAGVDSSVNPIAAKVLTAFAIAGGSGSYFPASDPATLATALETILAQVIAAVQSTSSTAVNSTGLNTNSYAYLAQFNTSDTPYHDWTGDLNAWKVDPTKGTVNTNAGTQKWSAQAQLDAQNWDTGRVIATWDPKAKAGTPFRWNPGNPPTGIAASTALGAALQTFTPDPSGKDVLEYLRGNSALEVHNGGQFRNRTHKLGDIVASAPLYVGPPNGMTQSLDYFAFAKANSGRPPVIYIGADDGMLHAFDPATGNELFAYIPNGVFNNLIKLVNPFYNDNHQFFVNGSPRSADVKFAGDGHWHTVLVGNLAAGGSTLFALDITDPATMAGGEDALAQKALWEFSDTDMGLSFSEPSIANTSAGWMVFAGNGYNSPNQKPVLYAIEPQHGTMFAKVDLCAAVPTVPPVCNPALANGLSTVTAVNTYGDVSGTANTVYAGDLQGNVWRVDISDPNPTNWQVSVIFQTRDKSGNIQPITTVPALTLNPEFPHLMGTMVYVGTGEMLGVGDLSSTAVQSVYGIFDPPTSSAPPPTRLNLVQQYLGNNTAVSGTAVRVVCGTAGAAAGGCDPNTTGGTPNQVVMPTPNRGWFVDLVSQYDGHGNEIPSGERVITDPQLEVGGGVVMTTYQPNPSTCTGGGSAWLMVFNYATGGSFPLPEFDTNSDFTLNSQDATAAGANPVGMSLGPVYASMPALLPAGMNGAAGTIKQIAVSSNNVDSILDRGGAKQRINWWEVRH